eukprot:CAMPEP_0179191726 /NCGR_PEP_ID=MMETSP0796-20121207/95236_1 /TAXON_ID=73915 /ORGANISM="Pyrodinium bahamense, Strain pbaha01" /LENGTH=66 /DNA_ID=CAMNT_0020895961 /DNA_START=28 /DNA_END=225 /DNA_ORIENTATION=+
MCRNGRLGIELRCLITTPSSGHGVGRGENDEGRDLQRLRKQLRVPLRKGWELTANVHNESKRHPLA